MREFTEQDAQNIRNAVSSLDAEGFWDDLKPNYLLQLKQPTRIPLDQIAQAFNKNNSKPEKG